LVIDALRELYQEQRDAVSQSAIAARAGLPRGNVSDMVPQLEKKQLISRGPSAFGRALRVFPTKEAERLLLLLYPRLDAISRRAIAPPDGAL
jgi:DNA-binding MarR family transcriptional regulator